MINLIWFLLILLTWLILAIFISYWFYLFWKMERNLEIQINEKRLYKRACEKFEKENKILKDTIEKMKNTWRKNRHKRK